MPDKMLTCRDCGNTFVFTAGEQEFFASKGYTNEPSRCPECREARKANRERFMKMAVPLGEKATFLKDGGEVVSGIRAMATFGHSPGHMSYHVESNGRRLLVWGDIANHYIFAVEHPDWHSSPDDNGDAAAATRRRVFDMVSADRLAVIGYHMPFPALGFVEKGADGGYRFVPASYQLML